MNVPAQPLANAAESVADVDEHAENSMAASYLTGGSASEHGDSSDDFSDDGSSILSSSSMSDSDDNLTPTPGSDNHDILQKLLRLQYPVLTVDLADYVSQPSTLIVLLRFITEPELEGEGRRKVVTKNAVFMSHQAMMLLCPTISKLGSFSAAPIVLAKRPVLVFETLAKAYTPGSHANLHHAGAVIRQLLHIKRGVILALIGRNAATLEKYIGPILANLSVPPTQEVLSDLLCLLPMTTSNDKDALLRAGADPKEFPRGEKRVLFQSLSKWRFMQRLLELCADSSASASACSYTIRAINRLAVDPQGSLLLTALAYPDPNLHLERLFNEAIGYETGKTYDAKCSGTTGSSAPPVSPDVQSRHRLDVLELLLAVVATSNMKSVEGDIGKYTTFAQNKSPMVPNQLFCFSERVHEHYFKVLPRFCRVFLENSDARTFCCRRLWTLQIIVHMMRQRTVHVFRALPAAFWPTLVTLVTRHRHASILHNAFGVMTSLLIHSDDLPCMKALLMVDKSNDLISTLVSFYRLKGNSSVGSLRGPILRCLNLIRLKAQSVSDVSAWLCSYLSKHASWQSFSETLVDVTRGQMMQPFPHPNKADHNNSSSMLMGTGLGELDDFGAAMVIEENEGIDIGSDFARELGFFEGAHDESPHSVSLD